MKANSRHTSQSKIGFLLLVAAVMLLSLLIARLPNVCVGSSDSPAYAQSATGTNVTLNLGDNYLDISGTSLGSTVNLGSASTHLTNNSLVRTGGTPMVIATDDDGDVVSTPKNVLYPISYSNSGNGIYINGNMDINQTPEAYKIDDGDYESTTDDINTQPFGSDALRFGNETMTSDVGSRTGLYFRTFPYYGGADINISSKMKFSTSLKEMIADPLVDISARLQLYGEVYDSSDNVATCDIALSFYNGTNLGMASTSPSQSLGGSSSDFDAGLIYSNDVKLDNIVNDSYYLQFMINNFQAGINYETDQYELTGWEIAGNLVGGNISAGPPVRVAKSGVSVKIAYIKVVVEANLRETDLNFETANLATDSEVIDVAGTRYTNWNEDVDGGEEWQVVDYKLADNVYDVKYVKTGDIIKVTAQLRYQDKYVKVYSPGQRQLISSSEQLVDGQMQTVNVYGDPLTEWKYCTKSLTENEFGAIQPLWYRNLFMKYDETEKNSLYNSIILYGASYLKKAAAYDNFEGRRTALMSSVASYVSRYALLDMLPQGYTESSLTTKIQNEITTKYGQSFTLPEGDLNLMNSNFMSAMDSYFYCSDLNDQELIQWVYSEEYMERVANPFYDPADPDTGYEYDLTGQTAYFRLKTNVGEVAQYELRLTPYLTFWDQSAPFPLLSGVTDVQATDMIFLLDNAAPSVVSFAANDDFYNGYIMSDRYYTDGFGNTNTVINPIVSNGKVTGLERKYNQYGAAVTVKLHSDVFIVSGSRHYIWYTTDGTDPASSPSRILLSGDVTDKDTMTLYFKIDYGATQSGVFVLQFAVYDFAGNCSEISERYNVKIDCTEYIVSARVGVAGSSLDTPNTSSTNKLGTLQFSKDGTNWRNAASYKYKRYETIHIRLLVKKQSQYKLSQYYNNGTKTVNVTNVNYGKWSPGPADNWGDFIPASLEKTTDNAWLNLLRTAETGRESAGIMLDDEMLTNINDLVFSLVFKAILSISVSGVTKTYDGMQQSIGQPSVSSMSDILITTYYVTPQFDLSGQPIEPDNDAFSSVVPPTNAGIYYYLCVIDDTVFCGERKGIFTIQKANPVITGLSVGSIVYGQSMAQASIHCDNITSTASAEPYFTASSSDGLVTGEYFISNPTVASGALYLTPDQGTHAVAVTFVPDEQFQSNYNTMYFNLSMYVAYSESLKITFDKNSFSTIYSEGVKRSIIAVSNPRQTLIVEYKKRGMPDSYYTAEAPIEAGIYEVRARTDKNYSNYDNQVVSSDGVDPLYFVIERATVNIEPETPSFYYQNDTDPNCLVFLKNADGSNGKIISVGDWKYYYRATDLEPWSDVRPTDAGSYKVRCVIDSVDQNGQYKGNYVGEAFTNMTIKRGNEDALADSGWTIKYPLLRSRSNANISYGQTLGDITFYEGSDYVARYNFREGDGYTERIVPGRFIIANVPFDERTYDGVRTDGVGVIMDAAYFADIMAAYSPNAGTYSQSKSYYIVFIPEDTTNFKVVGERVSVVVSQGTADFSNLSIGARPFLSYARNIDIFGFTRSESGNSVSYMISDFVTKEGVLVNPTVNGKPILGKLTLNTASYGMRFSKAGTTLVNFSFTPVESDKANVLTQTNVNIPITVNKGDLEMILQSPYYTDGEYSIPYALNYANPTVYTYILKNDGVTRERSTAIRLVYRYYDAHGTLLTDGDGAARTIAKTDTVGSYTMEVSADDSDWGGVLTVPLTIRKATPVIVTRPTFSTIYYMMDMSLADARNGKAQHMHTNEEIRGNFIFVGSEQYPLTSPDSVESRFYTIEFVPNDTVNVERTRFDVLFRVEKARTLITVGNCDFYYTGQQEIPEYDTSVVKVQYRDGNVGYMSRAEAEALDRTYVAMISKLKVNFTCNSTDDQSVPVNAGSYMLTATVDEDYFQGELTFSYLIRQVIASIVVTDSSKVQEYTGTSKLLTAQAFLDNGEEASVSITQTFYNVDGTRLNASPSAVGVYTVQLEIVDPNYRGTFRSDLTITIANVTFVNMLTNYGDGKKMSVTQLPEKATCYLTYRVRYSDGTFGPIMTEAPVNCGEYLVIASYPAASNSGFSAEYTSNAVINKTHCVLSYSGSFTYAYTGQANAKLNNDVTSIRTTAAGGYSLRKVPEWRRNDGEDFSSVEPTDAGVYQMRVTVDDNNYEGKAVFTYTINKARPTISVAPVVEPITYLDDGTAAHFSGGQVLFGSTPLEGAYYFTSSTATLPVGRYPMNYRFLPDDSTNFTEVYGVIYVTVNKYDLSDRIVFSGTTEVNYDTLSHGITAAISSGESVAVEVMYNGLKTAPTVRGSYVVSAKVNDKNYQGTATMDKPLVIKIGIPEIVEPKLTPVRMYNSAEGVSAGETEISGGFAYIKGSGTVTNGVVNEGTVIKIGGTFSLTTPSQRFYRANAQRVSVTFKPYSNDFATVTLQCTLTVIGTDPVIGTVVAKLKDPSRIMYYGHKVSDYYTLEFRNAPSNATPGFLSFADENCVPQTGEKVEYVFTPTDIANYNIVYGEVSVTVEKTTPEINDVEAKVFYGGDFTQSLFSAAMLNRYNESAAVDGTFSITSVQGFDSLSETITQEKVSEIMGMRNASLRNAAGLAGTLVGEYSFVSENYNTVVGTVTIHCFTLVSAEENIFVGASSVQYSGDGIKVSDLNISVSGTDHVLTDENFLITVFDGNGEVSDGAEIGNYTVRIELNDQKYYGSKTVPFSVVKRDLSAYLGLSYTEKTYGEILAEPEVVLSVDADGLTNANFTVEYKKFSAGNNEYNQTMPSAAMTYMVRITVKNSDLYVGSALCSFTVFKRTLTYEVSSATYEYGKTSPLTVNVEDGLAEATVYYYNANYSISRTLPTNIGIYTARVTVLSDNYRIMKNGNEYDEVSYTINSVPLTLRTLPQISTLTYGQKLSDCVVQGGRVTYKEGTEIEGEFTFVNGDYAPPVGTSYVSIRFVPTNSNYAPVSSPAAVTVVRAEADIVFTNLSAVYNGTDRTGELKYLSNGNKDWRIYFTYGDDNAVSTPIAAGNYRVNVEILNDNYQFGVDANGDPVRIKESIAIFKIAKAKMSAYVAPVATSIKFGQSLAASTLNSNAVQGYGVANYENIEGYVAGSFKYVNSGLVLGDAGKYVADVVFVPTDANNYSSFNAKVEVTVNISAALITVTDNTYEYGTPITRPTFTTNPNNLTVVTDMDCIGKILDCGVYSYRVWVVTKNYYDSALPVEQNNYMEFNVTVTKKNIRLEFTQNGAKVDKYNTTYQKMLFATAQVDREAVLDRDLYSVNGTFINDRISISYYNGNGELCASGLVPPSAIGDYIVKAKLDEQSCNYTGEATIYYDITLGVIESVTFDTVTLEQQIYGSVVPPIITTSPLNVSYYIDYQGYGQNMPTGAGTYNIVVYFNDANFAPKNISAMFKVNPKRVFLENIFVEDKVYDGVSTLSITAKLNGVLVNDEVNLSLKARTRNGEVAVGKHYVDIFEYTISGISADNYAIDAPYYNKQVTIFEKKLVGADGNNYVTSNSGFGVGTTVEFATVDSKANGESVLSNLFGQTAKVESFAIKDNGLVTTLDEKVKVYMKIPDEYLDCDNLIIAGSGGLADKAIAFTREGDYITFYTDSSGEVVFSTNDFNYNIIAIIAAIVVVIIAVVMLIMLNPMHKRSSVSNREAEHDYASKARKGKNYTD